MAFCIYCGTETSAQTCASCGATAPPARPADPSAIAAAPIAAGRGVNKGAVAATIAIALVGVMGFGYVMRGSIGELLGADETVAVPARSPQTQIAEDAWAAPSDQESTGGTESPEAAASTTEEPIIVPPTAEVCNTDWATLTASSTAPASVDALHNTVVYSVWNLTDGDPTTTWRSPGKATGETITIVFSQPCLFSRVGLLNGYQKVDPVSGTDRWSQNRRIAEMLLEAGGFQQRLSLNATVQQGVEEFQFDPSVIDKLTLTVISSYPDTVKRDFTALSEVVVG